MFKILNELQYLPPLPVFQAPVPGIVYEPGVSSPEPSAPPSQLVILLSSYKIQHIMFIPF